MLELVFLTILLAMFLHMV